MIQRWAHVKNGVVENVSLWDGLVTTWTPPSDVEMVLAPDNVGIGWQYADGAWSEPVPPAELVENPQ